MSETIPSPAAGAAGHPHDSPRSATTGPLLRTRATRCLTCGYLNAASVLQTSSSRLLAAVAPFLLLPVSLQRMLNAKYRL
jgi:hypothetical protein